MGHIGRIPIRIAWYVIVLPACCSTMPARRRCCSTTRRRGQSVLSAGARLGVYPLVALATVATIIASQAIITGSFSMTRQAMQLGWFPGVHIRQTSDRNTARSTCRW